MLFWAHFHFLPYICSAIHIIAKGTQQPWETGSDINNENGKEYGNEKNEMVWNILLTCLILKYSEKSA